MDIGKSSGQRKFDFYFQRMNRMIHYVAHLGVRDLLYPIISALLGVDVTPGMGPRGRV